MDKISFDNYKIAEISEDDRRKIAELEKSISSSLRKDIVLIAYESKCKEAGRSGILC